VEIGSSNTFLFLDVDDCRLDSGCIYVYEIPKMFGAYQQLGIALEFAGQGFIMYYIDP